MSVRPFIWEHHCRETLEGTEPSMRACRGTQCNHVGVPTAKHTPSPLPVLLSALEHKYLHRDRSIPWQHTQDPELRFSLLYLCGYL